MEKEKPADAKSTKSSKSSKSNKSNKSSGSKDKNKEEFVVSKFVARFLEFLPCLGGNPLRPATAV